MIAIWNKNLLPALFVFSALTGAEFTDFSSAEQAKKWQIERGSIEIHDSGLRFRVAAGAKGNYGVIRKRVKVPQAGGYLQVEQPNIEDAFAAPFLADQSKNGRAIGPVSRGLNTFDVSYRKGQSFSLAIRQTGSRNRKDVGPWADYKFLSVTEQPKGAVLGFIRDKKQGEALAAGDTLDLVYYPEKPIRSLKAEIVIVPGFIPYFTAELKADEKGVLRGSYTIPATLPGFTSTPKFHLAARSSAEGFVSTSVFGFPVKIEGKEKVDLNASFIPATPMIRKARNEWAKLTKGNNLARGKKVDLVPAATYMLTCDANDPFDLTDGKLSVRSDDRIWFDRHAVGWRNNIACMKIDLGSVKPVKSAVARMLSGASRINPAPSSLEVYVSRDGEKWHLASTLKKLQPGEKDQADWKTTFFLDESTEIFVWPFALDVNADARYILLRVVGSAGSITCDELAVLEGGKNSKGFNAAYQNPGKKMPLHGLVAQIRVGVLAIGKNMPMAQFLELTDLRSADEKKNPAQIVMELPAGVEVCPTATRPLKLKKLADGATRLEFSWKNLGKGEPPEIYLNTKADAIAGKAVVYAVCNGKEQFRSEYPVQVLRFPEFEPFKKLHVSLAWTGEAYQQNWPDFFRVWKRLGFNWINAFPMYHKSCPDAKAMAFYEEGKKNGFKLLMNLSVISELRRKSAKTSQVCCPGSARVCPSYLGEEYQKEMARVTRYVGAYKPQAFFDDNEEWTRARVDGLKCPRCQEAWKKSGKSWEEYLLSCGARYPADLKRAIEAGEKQGNCKVELNGSYDRSPVKPLYQIQRFCDIYPASINHSQPSLYVAGRGNIVRDIVRANCIAQKNKEQIAFLTAGTYGEFPPEKMELMVLESFLNGACGITFFKFSTFDTPLDFYYMSKALALLRSYEDFICKSTLADVSSENKEISISALRSGNEMLILAVNYNGADPETKLNLPVSGKVTDVASGKEISLDGKKFSISVPSGKYRLLHVR